MIDAARAGLLRLTLARACAWGLLIAGWIGIGSLALQLAPTVPALDLRSLPCGCWRLAPRPP